MPKINKLTWNGTASDTLGVFITGAGTFNAPELDVTAYEIPGRNGDLLIPNNRWKNIEVVYPCFVPDSFTTRAQSIRNWLRSSNTYEQLTDTYDSTHYREAIPTDILEFEPVNYLRGANFQIVFNAKPQRFITSGYNQITLTSGDVLTNPTQYTALPRFEVTGVTSSSTLTVTNSLGTFTLTGTRSRSNASYIDCERRDIYAGAVNLNDLFAGDFPVFTSGTNTVTFSNITTVKVRPRWWEL